MFSHESLSDGAWAQDKADLSLIGEKDISFTTLLLFPKEAPLLSAGPSSAASRHLHSPLKRRARAGSSRQRIKTYSALFRFYSYLLFTVNISSHLQKQ